MPQEAPEKLTKDELKQYAESIVVRQGNKYIRELLVERKDQLREQKIKIGANKEDFLESVRAAIDKDILDQAAIEKWLLDVEGWGNQHVYLFATPPIDIESIRATIEASPHAALLDKPVSWEFPESLLMTSIVKSKESLSIVWHCGSSVWERFPSKDVPPRPEEEGLIEYRAYRMPPARSVVRFEWRFADFFCAILMQLPYDRAQHVATQKQVVGDMAEIGLIDEELAPIILSRSVNAAGRAGDLVVRSTKMMAQGGHVDFVATQDAGIAGVRAVREVRRAVNEELFISADGMFSFTKAAHANLTVPLSVQVFGGQSRIRIWAQCKREDVYHVLGNLWAKNQPS